MWEMRLQKIVLKTIAVFETASEDPEYSTDEMMDTMRNPNTNNLTSVALRKSSSRVGTSRVSAMVATTAEDKEGKCASAPSPFEKLP